jgi:transposase
MEERTIKLRVIRSDRDGRKQYDKASKRALIEDCLRPGVSVARKAQENGINANLLRKWITRYLMERECTAASVTRAEPIVEPDTGSPQIHNAIPMTAAPSVVVEAAKSAFVPIVPSLPAMAPAPAIQPAPSSTALALHVYLPNGVRFDLAEANVEALSSVVQMLGRLPCSGSTKD